MISRGWEPDRGEVPAGVGHTRKIEGTKGGSEVPKPSLNICLTLSAGAFPGLLWNAYSDGTAGSVVDELVMQRFSCESTLLLHTWPLLGNS